MRRSLESLGFIFVLVTVAAACAAILLLMLEGRGRNPASDRDAMRLFQRAVGGLGMGAAAAPAWNVLHFDPRIQAVDDSNLWPIPGSYPYSPSTASTAVVLSEIPREDLQIVRIEP